MLISQAVRLETNTRVEGDWITLRIFAGTSAGSESRKYNTWVSRRMPFSSVSNLRIPISKFFFGHRGERSLAFCVGDGSGVAAKDPWLEFHGIHGHEADQRLPVFGHHDVFPLQSSLEQLGKVCFRLVDVDDGHESILAEKDSNQSLSLRGSQTRPLLSAKSRFTAFRLSCSIDACQHF